MLHPRSLALGLVALAATASTSCIDPVHADAVAALGDEAPGERPGEDHRAGQPCLTCHGGDGPGPDFSFAGTIYLDRDLPAPARGTKIVIREVGDETKSYEVTSNRVGNFYVRKDEFDPTFPVFVTLVDPRILPLGSEEMQTPIGRNGGCGFCHAKNLTRADARKLMPHVYLNNPGPGKATTP